MKFQKEVKKMCRYIDKETPKLNYDPNAKYTFDYSFKRKLLTLHQNGKEKIEIIPIEFSLKRTMRMAISEIFHKGLEKKLKDDLE